MTPVSAEISDANPNPIFKPSSQQPPAPRYGPNCALYYSFNSSDSWFSLPQLLSAPPRLRVRFPTVRLPNQPRQPSRLFSKFRADSPDFAPAFRSVLQWVLRRRSPSPRCASPTRRQVHAARPSEPQMTDDQRQ